MTSDRDRSVSASGGKDNTSLPALIAGQRFNPYKVFTGVQIPEAIARYRGLSPLAKLAWGRLARYAGENGACFPSIPRLAADIGVKDRRAQQVVAELQRKGFLQRAARYDAGKKGQTSNEYFFLMHSILIEGMALPAANPEPAAAPSAALAPASRRSKSGGTPGAGSCTGGMQDRAPGGVQDRAPFKRVNRSESV